MIIYIKTGKIVSKLVESGVPSGVYLVGYHGISGEISIEKFANQGEVLKAYNYYVLSCGSSKFVEFVKSEFPNINFLEVGITYYVVVYDVEFDGAFFLTSDDSGFLRLIKAQGRTAY